mgnify:CR=1 FL=1
MGSSMERASLDMMAVILYEQLNNEMKRNNREEVRMEEELGNISSRLGRFNFFLAGDGPVNLATVGEGEPI